MGDFNLLVFAILRLGLGPGPGSSGSVIFFPINAPGMGRFKLFDLVGYI